MRVVLVSKTVQHKPEAGRSRVLTAQRYHGRGLSKAGARIT